MILIKKIISIDEEKIILIDEKYNERQLYFEQCRINFYKEQMGSSYEITEQDRMIGERNIIGGPAYIVFYSNPKYQIDFDESTKEKFDEICDSITQNGWKTFDIS